MDEVSRLHEPGLVGVGCRLCSVPNIELEEDALDVCLYRPLADYEGFGDFGIGVPSGDELKDLLFATCEGGESSQFRCRATTGEGGCRLARDVIQSAVPAAWGRSYGIRDCRDCFRLRREHESQFLARQLVRSPCGWI